MDKFSLTDIKKKNYSDVYHYIYHNERSSKQAIATALQMSLPTVSQHLISLTEEGLIEKCGQLKSQIGRKAAAYSIVPQARIALGIEILKDRVLIVAVDLYGELIERVHLTDTFANTPKYFHQICQAIAKLIQKLSLEDRQILGAGFSVQGLVSQDGKQIIYGKILGCTGLTIDSFGQHLSYPCRFIHDSECAALSDLWNNTEISDAIYLSISHHLGGALIIDGRISSGRTGRSGTFEHMTLVPDGLSCYCGQKGCMECYCSIQALLNQDECLDSYFKKKEEGDPDALKRWDTFLTHLAKAINNLHMVIDCPVILGGHIVSYITEEDISLLHKYVQENTAFPEKESFISQGRRKKHAIALGAALPYVNEFLNEI